MNPFSRFSLRADLGLAAQPPSSCRTRSGHHDRARHRGSRPQNNDDASPRQDPHLHLNSTTSPWVGVATRRSGGAAENTPAASQRSAAAAAGCRRRRPRCRSTNGRPGEAGRPSSGTWARLPGRTGSASSTARSAGTSSLGCRTWCAATAAILPRRARLAPAPPLSPPARLAARPADMPAAAAGAAQSAGLPGRQVAAAHAAGLHHVLERRHPRGPAAASAAGVQPADATAEQGGADGGGAGRADAARPRYPGPPRPAALHCGCVVDICVRVSVLFSVLCVYMLWAVVGWCVLQPCVAAMIVC